MRLIGKKAGPWRGAVGWIEETTAESCNFSADTVVFQQRRLCRLIISILPPKMGGLLRFCIFECKFFIKKRIFWQFFDGLKFMAEGGRKLATGCLLTSSSLRVFKISCNLRLVKLFTDVFSGTLTTLCLHLFFVFLFLVFYLRLLPLLTNKDFNQTSVGLFLDHRMIRRPLVIYQFQR